MVCYYLECCGLLSLMWWIQLAGVGYCLKFGGCVLKVVGYELGCGVLFIEMWWIQVAGVGYYLKFGGCV